MGTMRLNDILITPLARIMTAGGDVLHAMMRFVSKKLVLIGTRVSPYRLESGSAFKDWQRHKAWY